MASKVLYPPIVDSYMPAFRADSGECRIYFSLSKFNSSSDYTSVQATVVKQGTGMNVVKKSDSGGRYRATGIILNIKPTQVTGEDNLYYITITDDDLSSVVSSRGGKKITGWMPGWIYKIQLRLSSVDYDGSSGQAAWINNHAQDFSEWSTICTTKAIGKIDYSIPSLSIDTSNSLDNESISNVYYSSTLNLAGHFRREDDPSEIINYCQFILYDEDDEIIDNSGYIYMNQYQDSDSFNYTVKAELENNKTYKLSFEYETNNHYKDGFYKVSDEVDKRYEFSVSLIANERIKCVIVTAENDPDEILNEVTSIGEEEDEGRIGLKLYCDEASYLYSGNICIRRADSRTNFKVWDDIKIMTVKNQSINDLDMIYDYVIESGTWYKYGVQSIDTNGNRGILNIISKPVMRNFEYPFILGKDNKQLKLMFENTMPSFKYQVTESKVDPIGAVYPVMSRNAATKYKTFPINGLVSFWMDENLLFCNKEDIFHYEDVIDLYEKYNEENNIVQYDYIYERVFREKVLEFLYDGELKLFKSPTEGNVIVRLTDVSCTPAQNINRLIYDFSSTALEMAAPTMENYASHGFYKVGTWEKDLSSYSTHLGQIQMDFPVGANIIQEIYKKYDSQGYNLGGYTETVKNIHHIKITFDGKPLRVQNSSNEIVVGNNFFVNNKLITVYSPNRQYEFDDNLIYAMGDSLTLLGDAEGKVSTISATIDFLYDLKMDVYKDKEIQLQAAKRGIGQSYGSYAPNTNLYKEIYFKYFLELGTQFQKLNSISSIEIEANPGTLFEIIDEEDSLPGIHEINITGQLRLEDISNIVSIKYLGFRRADGGIDATKNADILINYTYNLLSGIYKET